ncbi:MAG: PD-(D/E)XK nuclease family protein [Oscillospiraceae bacterium]|nr:PD-(D/E)XK nuclease family protein [Oscillospiraceae bacterium]
MLKFITGGAGTGKSREMMKRITEAVSQGRQVLAIVPDQFNFEYNRLLYGYMGMELFNRMEIVSFSRLARYIFLACGGLKGSYADDTVKNIIMSRAISVLSRENALSYYHRQAKRRSFTDDALEFVKTFGANNVSPEDLAASAEDLSGNLADKIRDVSLILSEYHRLLSEAGFKDNATDIGLAAEKAMQNDYFAGRYVFIDEFKSFTPDETEMLRSVIKGAAECTVCLTTENRQLINGSVFEVSDRTVSKLHSFAGISDRTHLEEYHRFKVPELEFYSRNVLRPVRGKFSGTASALKVFRAGDCYDETDYICAEINRLVSEEGYDYSDIAVASRNKEAYSSVIDAAFERYDIPFYTDEKQNASHKALIIFIRTAVKTAASKSFKTEDILRCAKTGFAGLDDEALNELENYCYKWGVDGTLWEEPFSAEPENISVEESRLKLMTPIIRLKEKASAQRADKFCIAVSDFLKETDAAGHIFELIKNAEGTDPENVYAVTLRRELKQLWEQLCTTLQSIFYALGDTELTMTEFADIFESAASKITLSAPPQTTNSVHFNAIHLSRFSNPRVLFIIGANENWFPFTAKASHLLTDRDILELNGAGIEIHGSITEKTSEERFAVYNAVSAPSERLYICYPSAEISGAPLYPSSVVKQTLNMFGSDNILLTEESVGALHYCRSERSGYYRYVQDHKRTEEDILSIEEALSRFRPENSRRIFMLKNPSDSERYTLSAETSGRLFGRNIKLSASRFEDYQKCPFMYLCKSGLKLYPRKKIEYNPQSRGNIIHYCMENVIKGFGRDFAAKTPDEIARAVSKAFSDYYNSENIGGGYGKTARFNAAYARLKETAVSLVMRIRDEFSHSGFTPSDFEYTFANTGTPDEPAFRLEFTSDSGEKCSVVFNGTIDRIDKAEINGKNYIRVVDYKTGSKDFSLTSVANGLDMQMLLYLFAVTDNNSRGGYHGSESAGILYMPARDTKLSDKTKTSPDEAMQREIRSETMRMKGLVLKDGDDASVICAMDDTVLSPENTAKDKAEADYIPVTLKKGVIQNANTATSAEFEMLREFCCGKLTETASKIRRGDFDAQPLLTPTPGGNAPCVFCDYRSVCSNYPVNEKSRVLLNSAEALKEIFGSSENDTEGEKN